MPPEDFSPEAFQAAKAIAVLEERTNTLGREMREMKEQQQRQWDEARISQKELKEQQQKQWEDARASQKELNAKLDTVLTAMSEARGGWRTIALIGGMCGTIGAAITWVVGLFSRGHL